MTWGSEPGHFQFHRNRGVRHLRCIKSQRHTNNLSFQNTFPPCKNYRKSFNSSPLWYSSTLLLSMVRKLRLGLFWCCVTLKIFPPSKSKMSSPWQRSTLRPASFFKMVSKLDLWNVNWIGKVKFYWYWCLLPEICLSNSTPKPHQCIMLFFHLIYLAVCHGLKAAFSNQHC